MGPRRTEKEEETGKRRDVQEMKIHGTEGEGRGERAAEECRRSQRGVALSLYRTSDRRK